VKAMMQGIPEPGYTSWEERWSQPIVNILESRIGWIGTLAEIKRRTVPSKKRWVPV